MVKIEATCPTCGPVECAPEAFELKVCNYAPASYYRFQCPSCHEAVQKAADPRAVEVLIAEGIKPVTWDLPEEALESHNGAPLNLDDLLTLHEMLERPDWFDQLARGVS